MPIAFSMAIRSGRLRSVQLAIGATGVPARPATVGRAISGRAAGCPSRSLQLARACELISAMWTPCGHTCAPSDQPEIVEKALTALSDFAGGLSLSQQEVDKERGVVIEEWRGGLGAGSRIRDKQFPILFYHSRYADRLPIGKPDIIRNAPVARLRAFYDTWYRPDRMAVIAVGDIDVAKIEQSIRTDFTPIKARAPRPGRRTRRCRSTKSCWSRSRPIRR